MNREDVMKHTKEQFFLFSSVMFEIIVHRLRQWSGLAPFALQVGGHALDVTGFQRIGVILWALLLGMLGAWLGFSWHGWVWHDSAWLGVVQLGLAWRDLARLGLV